MNDVVKDMVLVPKKKCSNELNTATEERFWPFLFTQLKNNFGPNSLLYYRKIHCRIVLAKKGAEP